MVLAAVAVVDIQYITHKLRNIIQTLGLTAANCGIAATTMSRCVHKAPQTSLAP